MKMKIIVYCLGLLLGILILSFAVVGQNPGPNGLVEIPFDFYHNQIVLTVNVNGTGPFNMLLDTGTDPSAVDITTAKSIGLKLGSKAYQSSGGGTTPNLSYATKLPLVQVGGLTAKNVDAAAIDLSKISERMGRSVHGVLGQSFLKDRILQIDYPHNLVRFYDRSPIPISPGQNPNLITVPFRYKDNVLIEGVSVNGTVLVANLDTGSSGTFDLSPAAVTLLGLDEEAGKAKVSGSVGYNGKFENHQGKLKNVTIGAISIDTPDVTFFSKGTGHDKAPWGINVGNGFLKDFVVTIDYRKKTITLEKKR